MWPLVGRQEELALVDRALAASGTSGLVLAGAAGVGKTRLARAALAAAEARGCAARWAVATRAAASIPLGAVAHLLPAVDAAAMDRFELFRRAAAHVVAGAGGARLALGVDDAHLLDDASAALLHMLAAAAGAFVVVTVRSGVPAPDPVVALWKDGVAERVEVQALGRGEADELVGVALRGQVDGTTLRELWEHTRGNPLFLRELIAGGLDSGALSWSAGVWRWAGPVTAAPRLVELVEAGLGRLDPEERDLLELLAFGEPLGAGLLERLVAAPVLASAERKGLLSVEQFGQRVEVRPVHPLYGEVVREQTGSIRQRLMRRRLADAVEAAGGRRAGDLLRVVTWRLGAGGPTATPGQFILATRQAMALFDYRLAERLARAAAEAGGGLEAEYLVGEALLALGRVGEAELVLRELEPRGESDRQRTQFAITRAFTLYWALNLPAQARKVLQQAQAVVSEPESRDELAASYAGFLLYGGSCTDALRAVTQTLDRPGTGDRAVLQALLVATPALFLGGRSGQAIAAARRGLDLARRLGEEAVAPWAHLQLSVNMGNAYLAAGRLDEAEALAEEGYRDALSRPWPVEKSIWAGWRGQAARARGQLRPALHWLREAAAEGQVGVPLPYMPLIFGEIAHAAALLGDLPEAEAALAKAEGYTAESARIFQLWVALARPWVAAARGQPSTAVTLALDLAERARAQGQVIFHVLALHDVARLGQPGRVAAALRQAVDGVEGQLAPVYAAHVSALAARDGPAVDAVASAFAGIGATLLAAEAAAEAAHAHRAAGHQSSARAAARKARALAAACDGARTPALDLLRQQPSLTLREHEIAGLAARGLPSRVIAERLVISVRTVDNTLHQVYGKLGLTNRAELGAALDPPDPAPWAEPSE
jgi:DNA-binding NarL/FixJ family response regulator